MEEMMIQADKMVSLGSLTAGVAHEINNPLGVIIQSIQNIERRTSPDFQKNEAIAIECNIELENLHLYLEKRGVLSYISIIRQSGLRAAGIINNMLNFSRKSDSLKSKQDIGTLLDHTLNLANSDFSLINELGFKSIEIEKTTTKPRHL